MWRPNCICSPYYHYLVKWIAFLRVWRHLKAHEILPTCQAWWKFTYGEDEMAPQRHLWKYEPAHRLSYLNEISYRGPTTHDVRKVNETYDPNMTGSPPFLLYCAIVEICWCYTFSKSLGFYQINFTFQSKPKTLVNINCKAFEVSLKRVSAGSFWSFAMKF